MIEKNYVRFSKSRNSSFWIFGDFLCEHAYTKNTTEDGELYSTYKAQNSNLSYMDPYGYADEETIC